MFNEFIGRKPFLLFSVPLVLGLLFSINSEFPFPVELLLLATGGVLACWQANWKMAWAAYFFLFSFPGFVLDVSGFGKVPELPAHEALVVKVTKLIHSKSLEARIITLSKGKELIEGSGGVILHARDTTFEGVSVNQLLFLNEPVRPIKAPKSGFDFQEFYQRKGIFFQAFLSSNAWKPFRHYESQGIISWLASIRSQISRRIEAIFIHDHYVVNSAMILGQRHNRNLEILQLFGRNGLSHVLVVSGLHVGLIYLMITSILIYLKGRYWSNLMIKVISFVLIWTFVLFTGSGPSVVRAALMISLYLIADALEISFNIQKWNLLFGVFFLMLVLKPLLIFDLGFQLSFAAVGSIFLFYEPILNKLAFFGRNKLIQSLSITTAAQLGTFPLILFYFNQISFSIWISNLMAAPWMMWNFASTGGILIMDAIGLPVSWLVSLSTLAFERLVWSLEYLDRLGLFYDGITIDLWVMWAMYGGVFCFYLILNKPKLIYIIIVLGLLNFALSKHESKKFELLKKLEIRKDDVAIVLQSSTKNYLTLSRNLFYGQMTKLFQGI